jgi:hypothetical protein
VCDLSKGEYMHDIEVIADRSDFKLAHCGVVQL